MEPEAEMAPEVDDTSVDQMNHSEMEKELEMLLLQQGGIGGPGAFSVTENNPRVMPDQENHPLTAMAAAEHHSPLADSIAEIYPADKMPTNYEKMNFVGRKTNVYPYTSNKLRQLKQHRARFQAHHADQYASMGPIRGVDPFDSTYSPF